MAKSAFVEQGEITEVYYNFGTFKNDQRKKFLKAPFDIVKIGGDEYVQPLPVGGSTAELSGAFNSSTFDTEQYLGRRDFGFIGGRIAVNENEWGAWQTEGLEGLHSFDFI
jgi:hypothetical protein